MVSILEDDRRTSGTGAKATGNTGAPAPEWNAVGRKVLASEAQADTDVDPLKINQRQVDAKYGDDAQFADDLKTAGTYWADEGHKAFKKDQGITTNKEEADWWSGLRQGETHGLNDEDLEYYRALDQLARDPTGSPDAVKHIANRVRGGSTSGGILTDAQEKGILGDEYADGTSKWYAGGGRMDDSITDSGHALAEDRQFRFGETAPSEGAGGLGVPNIGATGGDVTRGALPGHEDTAAFRHLVNQGRDPNEGLNPLTVEQTTDRYGGTVDDAYGGKRVDSAGQIISKSEITGTVGGTPNGGGWNAVTDRGAAYSDASPGDGSYNPANIDFSGGYGVQNIPKAQTSFAGADYRTNVGTPGGVASGGLITQAQQAQASLAPGSAQGTAAQINYNPDAQAQQAQAHTAEASQSAGSQISHQASGTAAQAQASQVGSVAQSGGAQVSHTAQGTAQQAEAAQAEAAKTGYTAQGTAEQAQASTAEAAQIGHRASGTAAQAQAGQAQASQAEAAQGVVDDATMTTEGRLQGLLSRDSAYMRRAAQTGLLSAAAAGLGTSSFAAGAAQGAAIDRAAPIAQSDAQAHLSTMQQNTQQQNQMNALNAELETQVNTANAELETAVSQGNVAEVNSMAKQVMSINAEIAVQNTQMKNDVNKLNAQLETAVSQGNAAEANKIKMQIQDINSRVAMNDAQMENSVRQMNAQLETAVSQGNAEMANSMTQQVMQLNMQRAIENARLAQQNGQFNADQINQVKKLNAQLETAVSQGNAAEANKVMMQIEQINADIAKQNAALEQNNQQFNAQLKTTVSSLNAELKTGVSQFNAGQANQMVQTIMGLRTQIASENARMKQNMEQFNIAQDNEINKLNAQLQTAVSQGNAAEQNKLNQQINALETEKAMFNENLKHDAAMRQAQMDHQITSQILGHEQAAELAQINAEYALLIQDDAQAASLYNTYMNGMLAMATNPEIDGEMFNAIRDTALSDLKIGLEFAA